MASKGPDQGGKKSASQKPAAGAGKPVASAVKTTAPANPAKAPPAVASTPVAPAAPKAPAPAPMAKVAKPAPVAAKPVPPVAAAKIEAPVKAPVSAKPVTPTALPKAASPAPVVTPPVEAAASASIPAIAVGTSDHPAETATPEKSVEKERTIMTTIENTMHKTQTMFTDMNDRAKQAMEKNAKLVEEMNELAKGNVEAVVESTRIAAKGMETLGQEAAEFSRKSFEQASAMMKSLAAAKSPTEFMKVQSDFFRTSFDTYVAEASKHTEAMLKLAGDAAQPISSRVAVAAEKIKVAA
ncbi:MULTISPECIES: phasin family protein [unclassified Sphingomonas]|uniref:phasin family protein n=1 Tax=unclassified Sphingomonas TaxID=196159 RepID=UPI0009EB06C3|nr:MULTISPECIES: phasin family protein [unclassified Sphingomonas]